MLELGSINSHPNVTLVSRLLPETTMGHSSTAAWSPWHLLKFIQQHAPDVGARIERHEEGGGGAETLERGVEHDDLMERWSAEQFALKEHGHVDGRAHAEP